MDELIFPRFAINQSNKEFAQQFKADCEAAGISLPSSFYYAVEKTGRILTKENEKLLSEKDLAEWDAAVEEYEEKFGHLDN